MKKLRRKEYQQSRTRQRVSRAGLFAGTQPAFRAGGRQSGGLSPSRATRCRTATEFSWLESERTISEDWVVRYDNRFFQLEPQSRHYAPAQGKVLVCEGRYGNIAIEYRGRALRGKEIPAPRKPSGGGPAGQSASSADGQKEAAVPPANHPWREATRRAMEKRVSKEAVATRPLLAWPSCCALNAPPFGLRRTALRTQANRAAKNRGCCRSTEIGIVVPRTP